MYLIHKQLLHISPHLQNEESHGNCNLGGDFPVLLMFLLVIYLFPLKHKQVEGCSQAHVAAEMFQAQKLMCILMPRNGGALYKSSSDGCAKAEPHFLLSAVCQT